MKVLNKLNAVKIVSIKDIKVNPKNRNKHPKDQIDRLIKILSYQGWRHPLVVSNRSGLLAAGHGRLEAAKKMKLDKVPVVYQDFESEEQEIAFGVSDNAIASWSDLDLEGIKLDVELIHAFDIELLGLKDFSLPDFEAGTLEDQQRLDQLSILECPYCKKHFEKDQARVIET